MKREKTAKTHPKLKLKLDRETLRSLEPPDLAEVVAGVTSACKSGVSCCRTTC
jgi:hypothetical protein